MTMISRILRAWGAMGIVALLAGCVAPTPYGAVAPVQPVYTDAAPYYDYAPEAYYPAPYPAYYDPYPYGVASLGVSVYGSRYNDDDYRYSRKRHKSRDHDRRRDRGERRKKRRDDREGRRGSGKPKYGETATRPVPVYHSETQGNRPDRRADRAARREDRRARREGKGVERADRGSGRADRGSERRPTYARSGERQRPASVRRARRETRNGK